MINEIKKYFGFVIAMLFYNKEEKQRIKLRRKAVYRAKEHINKGETWERVRLYLTACGASQDSIEKCFEYYKTHNANRPEIQKKPITLTPLAGDAIIFRVMENGYVKDVVYVRETNEEYAQIPNLFKQLESWKKFDEMYYVEKTN